MVDFTPLRNLRVQQVQPFTYRDGITFLELLERLATHVKDVLEPSLKNVVDDLVDQFTAEMGEHRDTYIEGVEEFQRIHDAFMADVNSALMALNDSAVSDLVNDGTSMLGATLRSIFPDNEAFDTFRQNINDQHQALVDDVDQFKVENNEAFDTFRQNINDQHQALVDDVDTQVTELIERNQAALEEHTAEVEENFLRLKSRGAFTAADFAIEAYNENDQHEKLQLAVNTAATHGVPFILDTNSRIVLTESLSIPSNTVLIGNGSTLVFRDQVDYVIESVDAENILLENFSVTYEHDTNHLRGIRLVNTKHAELTDIRVTSPHDDTGYFNNRANALNFVGCEYVTVSRCNISKWAWSMWVEETQHSTFRDMHIKGYRRGVHVWNAPNNVFQNITIEQKSPNADHSPGYNGFLIESYSHGATHNVLFDNCVVRDAGEHGIRIGGAHLVHDITFNNCEVRNVGRCGYKVMGGTYANANYHSDITFNNCRAIDGGLVRGNAYGFALHMVRNCRIEQPYIAAEKQAESFVDGFSLQGASNIYINQPVVRAWENKAIHVGAAMGSCENIFVSGGSFISSTGTLGIHIENEDVTFRKIMITGHPLFEIHPQGTVYHHSVNSSSKILATCVISFMVPTPSYSRLISESTTGQRTVLDIIAPYEEVSNSQFLTGSRWVDTSGVQGLGTKTRSGWVWQ